ncbi:unnamed protein product, partial [Effrenium voratum]
RVLSSSSSRDSGKRPRHTGSRRARTSRKRTQIPGSGTPGRWRRSCARRPRLWPRRSSREPRR